MIFLKIFQKFELLTKTLISDLCFSIEELVRKAIDIHKRKCHYQSSWRLCCEDNDPHGQTDIGVRILKLGDLALSSVS